MLILQSLWQQLVATREEAARATLKKTQTALSPWSEDYDFYHPLAGQADNEKGKANEKQAM